MASSTAHGFPYPDADDALTDYPATAQALADLLEARLKGEQPAQVIRGTVSAAGGVAAGSGFTATRTGTGRYTVNFTTAFATAPIVVAVAYGTSGIEIVTLGGKSGAGFAVNVDATTSGGGQVPVDQSFDFIAYPVA